MRGRRTKERGKLGREEIQEEEDERGEYVERMQKRREIDGVEERDGGWERLRER